jgi:hypothetical protein
MAPFDASAPVTIAASASATNGGKLSCQFASARRPRPTTADASGRSSRLRKCVSTPSAGMNSSVGVKT